MRTICRSAAAVRRPRLRSPPCPAPPRPKGRSRRPRRARAGDAAPAPARPAAGKIQLVLQKVGGSPLFAVAGQRVVVRGIVIPYVGGPDGQGQLLPRRPQGRRADGHRAAGRQRRRPVPRRLHEPLLRARAGARGPLRDAPAGRLHRPLAQRAASSTRTSARAPRARPCGCCSRSCGNLHYVVPLSGVFDEATGRALIAYRKMTNLNRIAYCRQRGVRAPERTAPAASTCATATTAATSRPT